MIWRNRSKSGGVGQDSGVGVTSAAGSTGGGTNKKGEICSEHDHPVEGNAAKKFEFPRTRKPKVLQKTLG